ncbi:MAG TPA: murein biosynthesis integral membrane protein MurJ [Acidimicrobiales bacterium]|nr:murein biosynthesis integral membrane protein MurJ [Acidimicrobiales bacterium]
MTDFAPGAAPGDEPLGVGGPPTGGRRSSLIGATAGMAVGTALSRITGVIKLIVLVYAIGATWFADGYNLANNTPNMIHDIVLGGVLSATFVPVFVDRLSTRKGPEAWRAISAVTTMTITLLAVASVIFWFAVPAIINVYTVANHTAQAPEQRAEAITLLKWFVPQLAFYGLISLFTALLNARRKFAMPMFVSVANNLVVIAALLWFHAVVGNMSLSAIAQHQSFLLILGLGTTLGVVVQALLLLPSLRRADLHIKFVWEPGHEAMRTIMRLAGWTFGLVLANQLALTIILALADGDKTPGAVSAYTYAYTFFQLPYGIIAVSIMSAVAPSLAERWALHDTAGFRRRMSYGLRGMLAIIIPATVGMLILAHALSDLIFAHGTNTTAGAGTIGSTLAMFSLGLPGFCVFLYMTRVLQSMQDTRTAFYLYVVENAINVVVGVALVGPLGVRGLALSLSIAYSVTAVLAVRVIRGRLGSMGGDQVAQPVKRVVISSAVMAVVTVLAVNVSSAQTGFGVFVRVALALVVGLLAYGGTAALLAARAAKNRRRPGPRSGGGPPASPPAGPPGPPDRPRTTAGTRSSSRGLLRPTPTFHGRLDQETTVPTNWRLRPVRGESEQEEEDVHGPRSGGDR